MPNENETPEEMGGKLLEGLSLDTAQPKFRVAPDVQPGDVVYLNADTGQYERASIGQMPHGVFDGHDVIISNFPFTIRHSPTHGDMTIDDISPFPGDDE